MALQAEQNVWQIWRENLLWSLATFVACAMGAVFVAAGILAVTPWTAIALLLLLAAVYITCRASADRIPNTSCTANS